MVLPTDDNEIKQSQTNKKNNINKKLKMIRETLDFLYKENPEYKIPTKNNIYLTEELLEFADWNIQKRVNQPSKASSPPSSQEFYEEKKGAEDNESFFSNLSYSNPLEHCTENNERESLRLTQSDNAVKYEPEHKSIYDFASEGAHEPIQKINLVELNHYSNNKLTSEINEIIFIDEQTIHITALKKQIIRFLTEYINRNPIITFFLRITALTNAKIDLAKNLINFVEEFTGEISILELEIEKYISKNVALSTKYGKLHGNLRKPNYKRIKNPFAKRKNPYSFKRSNFSNALFNIQEEVKLFPYVYCSASKDNKTRKISTEQNTIPPTCSI